MFPFLLALAAAQPAEPECRVLAQGDGYVVHAVPNGARTPGPLPVEPLGSTGSFFGPRYTILHTDLKTGRMKKLVAGGEWAVQYPPMAVDRAAEHNVTIGAVATGPDRLYVLVVKTSVVTINGGRPRWGTGTVRHALYVFRLADGSTAQEVVLPEPRERLVGYFRDSLDPDVIRVTPTTVTVGTVVYRTGERLELVESKP